MASFLVIETINNWKNALQDFKPLDLDIKQASAGPGTTIKCLILCHSTMQF